MKRIQVHFKNPLFPRDFTVPESSAACGRMIKSYDIGGMEEDPVLVTCSKCKSTLAYRAAVEGTPEGEKIWRKTLRRRIARL